MSQKLKVEDRVIIKTKENETFIGTVSHLIRSRIQLCDISKYNTDIEIEGTMTFFKDEIMQITKISSEAVEEEPCVKENETNLSVDDNDIKIRWDEYYRLKDMAQNFKFFDSANNDFKTGVDDLLHSSSIGVAGLGNACDKTKSLSLLVMSTSKQVYIFDMYFIDINQLKSILESEDVLKIVFNIRPIFHCLYHTYKIEMTNIVDIQILDSMLAQRAGETSLKRDLSQCLQYYLNIPESVLSTAVEDSQKDDVWTRRPLIKSDKTEAALLVTYLITLRDHLIGVFTEDHTKVVQKHYKMFETLADTDLLKRFNSMNLQ